MGEPAGAEVPENTPEQIAFHEAREAAAAEEKTYPLWEVAIEGDEAPWVPRDDSNYWMEDPENPGTFIPKAADELPEDAYLDMHNDVLHVFKKARGLTQCRAKSEEMAKMMALRDNPDYHTVVSVKQLDEGASNTSNANNTTEDTENE